MGGVAKYFWPNFESPWITPSLYGLQRARWCSWDLILRIYKKKTCIIFFFKFSNPSLIINLLCAVAYLVQCLAQCGQTCKENLGHGYL